MTALRRIAGAALQSAAGLADLARMAWLRLRLGSLGAGAFVYPRAVIYSPRQVHIGRRVSINDFVHIRGAGGVAIGDDTLIAPHVVITSQSHDAAAFAKGLLYRETSVAAAIRIGVNVWVGAGAVILPGVTIGDGAVIGAGAVVRRDVPSGAVVVGVPARPVHSARAAG